MVEITPNGFQSQQKRLFGTYYFWKSYIMKQLSKTPVHKITTIQIRSFYHCSWSSTSQTVQFLKTMILFSLSNSFYINKYSISLNNCSLSVIFTLSSSSGQHNRDPPIPYCVRFRPLFGPIFEIRKFLFSIFIAINHIYLCISVIVIQLCIL